MIAKQLLKLLAVECLIILLVTSAVVFVYVWLLPRYFHGIRTPGVLIAGALLAALAGGLAAKTTVSRAGARGWIISVLTATVTSLAVVLGVAGVLTEMYGS